MFTQGNSQSKVQFRGEAYICFMKWSKDDAGRQGRFCFLKMLESGSSKTQKVFVDSGWKTVVSGCARPSGRRQSEARGKEAGIRLCPQWSWSAAQPAHQSQLMLHELQDVGWSGQLSMLLPRTPEFWRQMLHWPMRCSLTLPGQKKRHLHFLHCHLWLI